MLRSQRIVSYRISSPVALLLCKMVAAAGNPDTGVCFTSGQFIFL